MAQTNIEGKEFLARTASGVNVYIGTSTLEHMKAHPDVNIDHIKEAIGKIDNYQGPFLIGSVDLGRTVGKDICVETKPEDNTQMAFRKGRDGQTPVILAGTREPADTSLVTVGMALDDDGKHTMFTSFYGQVAPKEPWDPNLKPEEKAASEAFWSKHALVTPTEAIDFDRTPKDEFLLQGHGLSMGRLISDLNKNGAAQAQAGEAESIYIRSHAPEKVYNEAPWEGRSDYESENVRLVKDGNGMIDERLKDKVANILEQGYSYQGTSSEMYVVANRATGSGGDFNEDNYNLMLGANYGVMKFTNGKGENRYCVVDERGELINKSPSSLRNLTDYNIHQRGFLNLEELQRFKDTINESSRVFFEKYGITTSPAEIFGAMRFAVSNDYEYNAEAFVDAYIKSIDAAILHVSELEAKASAYEEGKGQYKYGLDILHEINECGRDRQNDAVDGLTSNFGVVRGENSKEQDYIAKTVMSISQQRASHLIDDPNITFNAEMARVFGQEEKAFSQLTERVQEKLEQDDWKGAFNEVKNYTNTVVGVWVRDEDTWKNELVGSHTKSIRPDLNRVIVNQISKDPTQIDPCKINRFLTSIDTGARYFARSNGATDEQLSMVSKNLAGIYITKDSLSYDNAMELTHPRQRYYDQYEKDKQINDFISKRAFEVLSYDHTQMPIDDQTIEKNERIMSQQRNIVKDLAKASSYSSYNWDGSRNDRYNNDKRQEMEYKMELKVTDRDYERNGLRGMYKYQAEHELYNTVKRNPEFNTRRELTKRLPAIRQCLHGH